MKILPNKARMMPVSTPRPTSYPLLLAIYFGILIGGIALLYAMVYIVEEFFKTTFPDNNAMGLILVTVSTMTTATIWYNRERADPSSGRKWTLALLITIVTTALQAGLIYLVASVDDELAVLMREFGGADRWVIIGVIALLVVLEFLLIRASIWWGVRSAMKQAERKAAKSGR